MHEADICASADAQKINGWSLLSDPDKAPVHEALMRAETEVRSIGK